ncbi:glycosyltransferase [Clostridium perfringens]
MGIESKINYQLNKYPFIKKIIKRIYQRTMYTLSPKIKYEGNIKRLSPNNPNYEYFFGYYDKSPWDKSDRYILCMRARNTWLDVSPREKADILLIDTEKDENDLERVKVIASTSAWNVQQSCMLQWLGPDFSSKILYNDCRNGKYVSIILTISTGEEKVIEAPVYSVSADGTFALTLDFSRLYNLRPGYGYYNVPEMTKDIGLPDSTAIWKVDLMSGEIIPILKYTDFASFQPRKEMQEEGTIHKVNHIMLSPNGKRFMVLYRWFNGQRKYTRLITCNTDGKDMFLLSDDDMVSHCYWKDNYSILAFENKHQSGPGYYLMKDKTNQYIHCWPQFSNDGHPSYSPDGNYVVSDSYPDRARMASINLMDGNESKKESHTIVRVFAPFKYDNDTRCDLHPRWNHSGSKICFDSIFEGHRGLYSVDISENCKSVLQSDINKRENEKKILKYSIITPMYNSFNCMKRFFEAFENQTMKNFEIIIVDDCSNDGSYEKLLEFIKTIKLNIKVLKTVENNGPGNARNMGIKAAKGEWITFVDNDDWVDECLLEKVNDVIIQNDVNCVIYDYIATDGKKNKTCSSMYLGNQGIVSVNECIKNIRNHSVCKFYKSECIRNMKYPELRRCEDVAFVCQAIDACQKIYYLKEPMYYYLQRSSSLSNNKNLDESDMIKAFTILEKKLGDKYPEELKEKSISDLLYGVLLMMCKSGKSRHDIKSFIIKYEKKYPDWFNKDKIKKMGNAKYVFLIFANTKQIWILKILAKIHTKLVG